MTSDSRVALFTEQRCWLGTDGRIVGRVELGAFREVAESVPCTVVARRTRAEARGRPLLDHQAAGALLTWPQRAWQLAILIRAVSQIWRLVGSHRVTAVYCPGVVSVLAGLVALLRRRPLVVIVVGDPREALAPEIVPGLMGNVLRWLLPTVMHLLCRRADVARYVTLRALQTKYPPGRQTLAMGFTSARPVPLGEPREFPDERPLRLLTVATLDQPYKGVAELVESVRACRTRGYDVCLTVAGTGRLRRAMEERSRTVLGTHVAFTGHLGSDELIELMNDSHCFALASWTEGLPRALLEAMAIGLPAVATAVGGTTELLEPHRLVPPRDPQHLAAALIGLFDDPAGWAASSQHNLDVAARTFNHAFEMQESFARAIADLDQGPRR